MNTRNLLTVIAFGGVVALVACSSDVEDEKYASSESFCVSKAEALCNGLAKKCGAAQDACKSKQTSLCNSAASAAASQTRTYRANAAQDCIDSINTTYANGGGNVTPATEAQTNAVCERVYSGSKKENDACDATAFQCEGALVCDKGVCATETKTALDAQCNNAGAVCNAGSYCQLKGSVRFCVARNAIGETCTADAPCIETARCLTGSCAAKVTAGNPCDTDDQCAVEAPYCDKVDRKCRPKYESTSAACKDFGL